MRKVLVFGAGSEFSEIYGEFFSRHGFELELCSNPAGPPCTAGDRPVVLFLGSSSDGRDEEMLASFLEYDGKPPLIFVSPGKPDLTPSLKKLAGRARYVLPQKFLKKDLLFALKGSSEILHLSERVAALEAELAQKSNQLACILDVTRVLSSSLDSSKAMSKILEQARSIVGAQSWALFLADRETGDLVFSSAKGRPESKVILLRLATGEGISGWAAQEGTAKVVQDVDSEPRFTGSLDVITGITTRSVMSVPIIGDGRLLGVVEMINKHDPAGFTAKDVELVTMLMDQTALAIERSEMYQMMEDLSITDDLTKLFNLRYLDRTLDVELERAARYNLSVSLIFMDVDHFKDVNDRYGHLVGSKLLVEVSRILLKGLRKVDIVARYGGDEFVMVLPQTDVSAAKFIADRLRRAIERHVFLESEKLSLSLTASFGIASFPEHARNRDELLQLADEAMYRVKYQTRNDVYVAGS